MLWDQKVFPSVSPMPRIAHVGPLAENFVGLPIAGPGSAPAGCAGGNHVIGAVILEQGRRFALPAREQADEVHAVLCQADRLLRHVEVRVLVVQAGDKHRAVLFAGIDDIRRPVVVDKQVHVAGKTAVLRLFIPVEHAVVLQILLFRKLVQTGAAG